MNTIENINNQLLNIELALKWFQETESMKGLKYNNARKSIVNLRRVLKRKKDALEGNAAAAIYGASQMGKSYLVSNLLSISGETFKIIDGHANEYVFLDQINPEGKGKEATSLVTRFSVNYKWLDPKYPVKAKFLTVADLVLVLCDSFYNDVKTNIDITLKEDELNKLVEEFCGKYHNHSGEQTLIHEDEILDIKDYFLSNFSVKASNIIHSNFFTVIPALISKTQPQDWSDLFSLLWNRNIKITILFKELLQHYEMLNFSGDVYIPIDSVLRNKGTILDVARLHEIKGTFTGTESAYEAFTSVLVPNQSGNIIIRDFPKSYLCALIAELTFVLPDELKENKLFLKDTDLLDFPGARNRLAISEEEIADDVIPNMLLRGKVSYLFNKYSYSEKVNILLFCQNNKNSEVQNIVPDLLFNWIRDMIGSTPEERNAFMQVSKIPPLFLVSTMFNLDLQFDYNNDKEDNIDARNNRWKGRFITVFNEIFGSKKWLKEWTTDQPNFQNIFLLRDFRFSADTECNLFKGYNEGKKETEEIINGSYPGFRQDLRASFIEYEFVKHHFQNPELSWDSAASINQDGTQLIIEKLTVAAATIKDARYKKTVKELNTLSFSVLELLESFYNNAENEQGLTKAIETAGKIYLALDIAFNANPYFFGPMMKELMLNKNEVYKIFTNKIREIDEDRRKKIDLDKYLGIIISVSQLSANLSFEDNLELLRKHYEIRSIEECKETFEQQGIDLNELFYGGREYVKNSSDLLVETLEKYWYEHKMKENIQNLSDTFGNSENLENIEILLNMFKRLYQKLEIRQTIVARIRRFVDHEYRNAEDAYDMISDISAEMINTFINTVGLAYYNQSNFNDLEAVSEHISGLSWNHDALKYDSNSKTEVAELIDNVANLPVLLNQTPLPKKQLKMLPNYRSYIIWYDLLKAGFVISNGVPNYDPISNDKLGKIINNCQAINFE